MKTCLRLLGSVPLTLLLFATPASAVPIVLDFDTRDDGLTDIVHGEVITDQYLPNYGVVIEGFNNHPGVDLAVAFDSALTGTRDPDLQGPPASEWDAGNLVGIELGNLVIIQENNFAFDVTGTPPVVSLPDDEGRRISGSTLGRIEFSFSSDMTSLEFDIVDREGAIEDGFIEFFKDGSSVGSTITFGSFADSLSPYYDPTVTFGNNTANHISTVHLSEVGIASFDGLAFHLGGSGAFDNIAVNPIPEPGAVVLFCAGALVVAWSIRRQEARRV